MFSRQFIKATETFATYEKPVNAPYIRKSFTLDTLPEKAAVTLTSTGFYRLFVNGTEVTPSRLAPGITNPDQIIFYDTVDVRPYLVQGENVLGFLLGNGISNCIGGFIWDFDKALFRSAPKLAVSFESDALSFEADASFKCAPSPITFDDLRSGEHYDATLEKDGWNKPGFDDADWTPAIPTDPARGKAEASDTDPVVVTKELKPVEIVSGSTAPIVAPEGKRPDSYKLSETAFYKSDEREEGIVFKFAENTACVPRLRVKGKKGQKIVIQAAEYCSEDNVVSYENIARFYPFGFTQRDIYICKGEGTEEYVPSFTYHGARYFLVIGLEKEQIGEDTLTMLVQNSDLAERGNFSCSDPIANGLQRGCRISTLANFVWFPTDCPHREKNGWTGDASMSAEHMMQNIAPEKSWNQWLKMIAASQDERGAIPGIVPTSGWGFAWGNGPAWDEVMTELPYQTYRYRGDLTLFKTVKTTVFRYFHYLAGRRDGHGLVAIGLGDWCHAMRPGGSNHVCPLEVTDTAISYNMCCKAQTMYRALGMTLEADFAASLGSELRAAFRKYLIDPDTMNVKGSCQTAQAAALYYGLFDGGEKAAAYARLLELVHEADDHFDCGMIGVRVLFRTLAAFGDAELAYKLITRTDAPSYGIWIDKFGLASLAESFHDCVNGHDTSLNHHFMGDFSGFFIAHVAGLAVNPYGDDPAFVRFAPNFIASLDHAEAWYDTTAGKVSVRWERDGDRVKLTVEKAAGVHGELVLPKGYVLVSKSGSADSQTGGRRLYALENGAVYIAARR